jgi:histone H3/H4
MSDDDSSGNQNESDSAIREQDRYLPIANINRIMRKSLPNSAKISKDAKECVQECVSEFVSFITSEASEKCVNEKRKTINGDDIIVALSALGFDNYVEPLRLYLHKLREFNSQAQTKKPSKRSDEPTQTETANVNAVAIPPSMYANYSNYAVPPGFPKAGAYVISPGMSAGQFNESEQSNEPSLQ